MSIDACRRAQQSVHAQAQIDEEQFAVDIACDVPMGIFKRLPQIEDVVMVDELAEFGQKRLFWLGQTHQRLRPKMAHNALSHQMQGVVQKPFLTFPAQGRKGLRTFHHRAAISRPTRTHPSGETVEVGLIFASIGKSLGIVSGSVFSALVVMVIVTTLMTPIALKWSLFRKPQVNGTEVDNQ